MGDFTMIIIYDRKVSMPTLRLIWISESLKLFVKCLKERKSNRE